MKKIKHLVVTKAVGFYINLLSYINAEKALETAYRFFSNPRKGKLKKSKLPIILQNSTLDIFEYNGEKFQSYIWQGDENVILLVHGWESNSKRWKKLLQHLTELKHTIIAIDAPAHGLSSGKEFNTQKYAALINVLAQKYHPKVVVGHSLGGATITYYLHKYKNPNIEKVILLGTPSDFKILSDNFVSLLSLNKKVKAFLEKHYKEKFNIDVNDFSGHKFALEFSQKALIAHDIEDNVVHIEEGRKFAKTWKNAIYIETKGLGHALHDYELYRKIVAFIMSK